MGLRFLVIDDSPFIFKTIKKVLDPEGYEIVGHALNGQEGLDMIRIHQPQIIFLDITMPIMDGLETANQLHKRNTPVKIIMMSAMGDDNLLKEAKSIGVSTFLSKPFSSEDLLNAVRNLVETIQLESSKFP